METLRRAVKRLHEYLPEESLVGGPKPWHANSVMQSLAAKKFRHWPGKPFAVFSKETGLGAESHAINAGTGEIVSVLCLKDHPFVESVRLTQSEPASSRDYSLRVVLDSGKLKALNLDSSWKLLRQRARKKSYRLKQFRSPMRSAVISHGESEVGRVHVGKNTLMLFFNGRDFADRHMKPLISLLLGVYGKKK